MNMSTYYNTDNISNIRVTWNVLWTCAPSVCV